LTYAVVSYRDRFYRLFEIMTNKELTVEEFCDGKKNVAFATQEWFDGWRKAMPAKVIARVRRKESEHLIFFQFFFSAGFG
jgi:hypothetical protein